MVNIDKKNLVIGMVLLVVAVLVVANFDMFTGQVISGREKAVTKIFVSGSNAVVSEDKPMIDLGNRVYFTVETGSMGSDGQVKIYALRDKGIASRKTVVSLEYQGTGSHCSTSKCLANTLAEASYPIGSSWTGGFYGCVTDKLTKKEVCSGTFIVNNPYAVEDGNRVIIR